MGISNKKNIPTGWEKDNRKIFSKNKKQPSRSIFYRGNSIHNKKPKTGQRKTDISRTSFFYVGKQNLKTGEPQKKEDGFGNPDPDFSVLNKTLGMNKSFRTGKSFHKDKSFTEKNWNKRWKKDSDSSEKKRGIFLQNADNQNIDSRNDTPDVAETFGWKSSLPDTSNKSVNVKSSSLSESKMQTVVKSNTAIPPQAKIAIEAARKVKEYIVSNLQRQYVEEDRKEKEEKEKKDKNASIKEDGKKTNVLVSVLSTFASSVVTICGTITAILGLWFIPVIVMISIIPAFIYVASSSNEKTIVTVAQAELAVAEDNIGGEKYREWYGVEGNWCAMFVSWCANECGYIEAEIMPKECSVANMSQWYKDNGYWVDVCDADGNYYEPKATDIIFFQNDMSHVGIVVGYDAGTQTITTIEGNTGTSETDPYYEGSQVKEKTYTINYSKISGYGLPDYASYEESTEEETETETEES